MRRWLKRLLLYGSLLLLAGAVGGAWWWARQSLPTLDGELRLDGLTAPVEVLADGHGVPHVYASGPEDAWFTAGALHARDRLWQMELYRRAARGRLSEVLGDETLALDKRLLTLRMEPAAAAEWQAASPAVRAALSRYAAGVNSQMALLVGRRMPLEFQLLRFSPGPWTEIDSLVIGRLLAWRLAENHQAELVRSALAAQIGVAEAQRLAGAYPSTAPTILGGTAPTPPPPTAPPTTPPPVSEPANRTPPNPTAIASGSPSRSTRIPAGLEWLAAGAHRGNSNNFVVTGRRTTSGRPLLANDPHLQNEFPGAWYEMHLVAAGLDVIGVTIPGSPFVILGHNSRVAWGMTNTGADVQDFYVERIDVAKQRYFYQGQWQAITVTRADVPVRGRANVPFEVWSTRHGGVFAEVGQDWDTPPAWLSPNEAREGEKRAFALQWDITRGETAGAFEAINRANDWTEFVAAVERFSNPSQNIVYADIEGNIGYAMSGILPIRASGDGTMPRDGSTGDGEWAGRTTPSAMPRVLNPPAGYITSSNNEVDRRFGTLITKDWSAPYRTTRLHHLLTSNQQIGVSSAGLLQNDVTSVAAEHVLGGVDGALSAGQDGGADPSSIRALERLRSWDRRIDQRPVVALYEVFEDALWRRTFADEMGETLFDKFYEWAGAERAAGLYAIIDDAGSRWFDDIATIDRKETRNDVFLLAIADAVRLLQRDHGGPDDWDWSELHAVSFRHPMGQSAPLSWLFNRGPSPIGGDGTTVMRVSYNRLQPFAAWELPSWRQILDVGNWDDSRVVLPGGQSGHPMSPYYFDQNDLWRQGQYRAQPYSRTAVDQSRAHRLLLLP